MKILMLFILVSLSFSASSSFANIWSGEWEGQGLAKTNRSETGCDHIEMRLLVSEDKLVIRGGGYKCGQLSAEYPYSTFELAQGRIVYQGQEVGTFSESLIHLVYDEGQFNLWLQREEGGSLSYKELWSQDGDYLLIEGSLNPRN